MLEHVHTVQFSAQCTMGSTTTYGSGAYSVALPVAAAGSRNQLVKGRAFDNSSGFYYRGIGGITASASTITRAHFVDGAASSAGFSPTVPMTWATSDVWEFCDSYEAA